MKTRKAHEQKGETMKYLRIGGFTESGVFTHILMFVVASIMVLVAGLFMALDKMDWLGLSPSVRSSEILLIESVGGTILVFAYA